MHETGIALEIVRIAVEALNNSGQSGPVKSLHLKVGRWSGVEPGTLSFALEAVCAGTALEGARAEIESVEPSFFCETCGKSFTASDRFDPCPWCGGPGGRMTAGDELLLTHIEVGD